VGILGLVLARANDFLVRNINSAAWLEYIHKKNYYQFDVSSAG
jgi:hypothetical protein